ncbi:MAG: heme-binding domain-containing protein [Bacteroidota bacterium]
MKKGLILIVMAGGFFFLFQSFNSTTNPDGEIPKEVNEVLVSSCYDCHSTTAKNQDARDALNFEKWDEYRVTKKIGLLGKTGELIEEEKMPPAKYLGFKPDRKLSETQKQMLLDWTKKESSALMEGN